MGPKNVAPTGVRTPDRPSRNESLYRLRCYPVCTGGYFPGAKKAGLRANDSPPFNAQVMNEWNHTCMPPCFHGTCLPSKGYRQCPVLVTRCTGLFNTGWGDRKWTQEMSTAVEVPLHIRPVSKHKLCSGALFPFVVKVLMTFYLTLSCRLRYPQQTLPPHTYRSLFSFIHPFPSFHFFQFYVSFSSFFLFYYKFFYFLLLVSSFRPVSLYSFSHPTLPLIDLSLNAPEDTRWFKYDRDYLCVNKSQFVPVIFEPPCIYLHLCWTVVSDGYIDVYTHTRTHAHTGVEQTLRITQSPNPTHNA